MLEISSLRGGYGRIEVLRGIDLSLRQGEIVALLGSNGAGKSTLNNTVCGLFPAFSGRVSFEGRDITRANPAEIVAAGLIQVPEGRRVFPDLSVRENLELGSYRRGRAHRETNLEKVLVVFSKLKKLLNRTAGTLSGGEQQMLAIGRGLMAEPKLLILDEPSLGLSPLLVEELFKLIKSINEQGIAMLLVEQNVRQSLEVASRAYVLDNGAIVLQGNAAEVRDDPNLKRAYLGM